MPVLRSLFASLLLVLLAACGQSNRADLPAHTTAEQDADFVRMVSAGRMLPELQTYLKSREPPPRTFSFDRLNFDPGSAKIRPIDEQTIYALANALDQHANVRAQLVGYDDGSRSRRANPALGEQRAASIMLALRNAGVSQAQLEIAAGRKDNGARAAQLVIVEK